MKRLIKFILLATLIVMNSCDGNTNNWYPSTDNIDIPLGAGTAKAIIVKFDKAEDTNHILVGEAIDSFTKDNIQFNGNNIGLYLQQDRYTFNSSATKLSQFAETNLNICQTSPYIELTNGYYLLTWEWADFSPLATITKTLNYSDFTKKLRKELPQHLYLTKCDKNEIDNLSQTWQASELTEVKIKKLYMIPYYIIDDYAQAINNITFGKNETLYWSNGMSAQTAMELNEDWTLDRYSQFCDSMTLVYKQRLTNIINNNDLQTIGYEIF